MIVNFPRSLSRFTVVMTVLSFLLLFTILIFIIVPSPCKSSDSLSMALSIMGTIVTALGFAAGLFFVLLALDAYAEIQKLKEVRETTSNLQKESERQFSELHQEKERMLKELAESMDYFLGTQLAVPTNQQHSREQIHRRRSLFALHTRHLNARRRSSLIRDLKKFGREDDIPDLQRILEEPTTPDSVKEVVEEVIEVLEKKRMEI
jgi:uncharacterized membrane protein YccC